MPAVVSFIPPDPSQVISGTTYCSTAETPDLTDRLVSLPFHRGDKLEDRYWAVTCHFNPMRYRRKLVNYKKFRDGLAAAGIKLLTVELAYAHNPVYELDEDRDADKMVRVKVRSDSIMWHKENLLNIGVKCLPPECDRVCFIDADVIMTHPGWVEDTDKLLDTHAVVQPFYRVWRLEQNQTIDQVLNQNDNINYPVTPGGEYGKFEIGWVANVSRNGHTALSGWPGAPGFIWCIRREVLYHAEANNQFGGLFDRMLTGAGDVLLASAVFGQFGRHIDPLLGYSATVVRGRVNALMGSWRWCYDSWARTFYSKVLALGGVTYYPQTIFHMWHGSRADRQYESRMQAMEDMHFSDVQPNGDGVLEWVVNKPRPRNQLQRYFQSRNEDGEMTSTEVSAIRDIKMDSSGNPIAKPEVHPASGIDDKIICKIRRRKITMIHKRSASVVNDRQLDI